MCIRDSLLTLLEVSAPRNGVFEDLDNTGTLTGSVFDFSTLILNGIGEYNFRYTLDLTPCDTPTQNFVIQVLDGSNPPSAGESITSDGIVKLCTDDLNIILFDQLQNADPIGQWTGPGDYISEDHRGVFTFNDQTMDDLVEGEYTYTIDNEEFCTSVETTTITIQFVTPVELALSLIHI